jgi:serine/threonine protein kinase
LCPPVESLATFVDGDASTQLADEILRHIDVCADCYRFLAASVRSSTRSKPVGTGLENLRTFGKGDLVGSRYRIVRFLAHGGMGEVYEAWDALLEERVALKTIVCTGLDDERLLRRLRTEVRLARRISHPNVCRILEFSLHERRIGDRLDAIPFFTMELLTGETLTEYAARIGVLDEAEALNFMRQIAEGIGAMHDAGIVHRDLKPSNVFVIQRSDGGRRLVVTDFGLARSFDVVGSHVSSASGSLVGTPAYMAPEQVSGAPASPAWDIYALGLVTFELLTRQLPFSGATTVALAAARITGVATRISRINPSVSAWCDELIARCLERDPNLRIGSMSELCEELNTRPQGQRLRQRRLLGVWLGVALLAALLGYLHGRFWSESSVLTPQAHRLRD